MWQLGTSDLIPTIRRFIQPKLLKKMDSSHFGGYSVEIEVMHSIHGLLEFLTFLLLRYLD